MAHRKDYDQDMADALGLGPERPDDVQEMREVSGLNHLPQSFPVQSRKMNIPAEQFITNGFLRVIDDYREGTFYVKTLKACAMPYFFEHVVDGKSVFETDNIVVEVGSDGYLKVWDENTDYCGQEVPMDSPEGRALLADAGFVFS